MTGFLSMNISFRVRMLSSRCSIVTWNHKVQDSLRFYLETFFLLFSKPTLLPPPEVIALVSSDTSWSSLFQQTHRVSAFA